MCTILDRCTILCLFFPGFQKLILKQVSNCKWSPLTKFPRIPRANNCNVNFLGTFVVSRFPQQASIASCSGFRNCKRIPQNVMGIRKCKWNPQTVSGLRILFITELACEQLKARTGNLIFSNKEFKSKNLTNISGFHEQIVQHLLTKSVAVIFQYLDTYPCKRFLRSLFWKHNTA